jgi:hypothetical protein
MRGIYYERRDRRIRRKKKASLISVHICISELKYIINKMPLACIFYREKSGPESLRAPYANSIICNLL